MTRRERVGRWLAERLVCGQCCALRIGPGHLSRRVFGVCGDQRGRGGMEW